MKQRIEHLQNKLKSTKLDGILVSNPYNITYLSGFTGLSPTEYEAWILVLKNTAYLFTNSLYYHETKRKITDIETFELTSLNTLSNYLQKLVRKGCKLGIETGHLTVKFYDHLLERNTHIKFIPCEPFIENLRLYKDFSEIENIKKAVAITDKTWSFIRKNIKLDSTEAEISFTIEHFMRTQKADDVAWRPIIVAISEHSANPHHTPTNRIIKKGDLILIDMGAKVNGYISDMTRIFFTDTPSDIQSKVYTAVLEAQEKALQTIQPHILSAKVDKETRKIMTKYGFKKDRQQYPHNLGHGVGLEIHEKPSLGMFTTDTIENNMVFTIEPAIYLSDGFGVRIEDTVMMNNGKLEILTKSPKEIVIL